ncbi:hypothetical protein TorRG33x02_104230, partial [Trema orientale]
GCAVAGIWKQKREEDGRALINRRQEQSTYHILQAPLWTQQRGSRALCSLLRRCHFPHTFSSRGHLYVFGNGNTNYLTWVRLLKLIIEVFKKFGSFSQEKRKIEKGNNW